MSDVRRLLAVFIDFENLALGFRDRPDRFDIHRVIGRLVEKGNIVVKRAYADWRRFGSYSAGLHEHAIELIQIPSRGMTGKNSADMRLSVDVMDLCYSKAHIDTFVILSGDSDFSPLVSKLKENGKTVIGLGVEESTSDLLRDNCDEFIYYEDLEKEHREVTKNAPLSNVSHKERQLYELLLDSLHALRRENRETYWASLVKETMKRKRPSFNEGYYGFKTFGDLLESAAERGLVTLSRDGARRTHIVTAFGADVPGAPRDIVSSSRTSSRSGRSRSRGGRGRNGRSRGRSSERATDDSRQPGDDRDLYGDRIRPGSRHADAPSYEFPADHELTEPTDAAPRDVEPTDTEPRADDEVIVTPEDLAPSIDEPADVGATESAAAAADAPADAAPTQKEAAAKKEAPRTRRRRTTKKKTTKTTKTTKKPTARARPTRRRTTKKTAAASE